MPFPYARLIVGTRHCRLLILANINSDANGFDIICYCQLSTDNCQLSTENLI
jgi:hypothetical protein